MRKLISSGLLAIALFGHAALAEDAVVRLSKPVSTTVKLAGTLERVEVSPEQAAHFAEDLGDQPETGRMADFEYQIMATAVRIPRA